VIKLLKVTITNEPISRQFIRLQKINYGEHLKRGHNYDFNSNRIMKKKKKNKKEQTMKEKQEF